MKYTQIPTTAFQNIQLNAGVLVDDFDPVTGVIGRLLGATSGGVNFTDTATYKDFGDDIDNCPKNMLELKKLESHEVKMTGTFVTVSPETAKVLVGVGDVDPEDNTHIIPRNDVLATDFVTLWWIGDYSDINTGNNPGFIAIKLINALSTGGFQIQSTDREKGKFAFEFMGHYSMAAQDQVPYEIYIKQGSASTGVTIKAEAGDTTFPWTDYTPSDFQSDVAVSDDDITGTLMFIEGGLSPSGPLAGDGNFIALKFNADWSKYTSVKIGLDPSEGTGLVEIIDDPDKNAVIKITNKQQIFKVVATLTDGTIITDEYSLATLVLETE